MLPIAAFAFPRQQLPIMELTAISLPHCSTTFIEPWILKSQDLLFATRPTFRNQKTWFRKGTMVPGIVPGVVEKTSTYCHRRTDGPSEAACGCAPREAPCGGGSGGGDMDSRPEEKEGSSPTAIRAKGHARRAFGRVAKRRPEGWDRRSLSTAVAFKAFLEFRPRCRELGACGNAYSVHQPRLAHEPAE